MATSSFKWDPNKALTNLQKHQVSFEEAATIFDDPVFITVIDLEHSTDEERYITIGISNHGRLLMVAHTDRENEIRIINARKATRKEAKFYEEAN